MKEVPRLKELREAAGFSQYTLAEESGISRAAIAGLEAGKRVAQSRTVRRLAETLGVAPAELYGELPVPLAGTARGWLLEQTDGRHAWMGMREPETHEAIRGTSLEDLPGIKWELDVEKSLIEHAFESELGHPVHVRKELADPLYEELRAAWRRYVYLLKDLDRRSKDLREERPAGAGGEHAGEARLVSAAF